MVRSSSLPLSLPRVVLVLAALFIHNSSQGVAAIVSVSTTQNSSNELLLEEVHFGSPQNKSVAVADMVGISNVFHFGAASMDSLVRTLISPRSAAELAAGQRHQVLTGDHAINTGIANVGFGLGLSLGPISSFPTAGLGVNFSQPIINGIGPDIVIAGLSNLSLTPATTSFIVSGIRNGEVVGTASINAASPIISFSGFPTPAQGHATSPAVYRQNNPVTSLNEFETFTLELASPPALNAYSVAFHEVDLNSLGLQPGETITGLFIQSAVNTGSLDLTFIAGLYPVPEPNGTLLMVFAFSGMGLMRRRLRASAGASGV